MVFGANAAHEAGNDAALRKVVEHRELFRDVNRVVHERQRAAENRNFNRLRPLNERAGDQVRRRHQAIGGLVMFIDPDRVKAELFGIDERIDMARILEVWIEPAWLPSELRDSEAV